MPPPNTSPAAPALAQSPPAPREPLQPVAAVLAFLFPGLGHAFLGYTRRGLLIAAGVLGLFLSGLLIGGIDSVDSDEDFIWFLGQALVGPTAIAVDYAHQTHFKVDDPIRRIRRSAHPNEFRDPVTRRPVPISIDTSGKSSATYDAPGGGAKVTVSPAYPPNVKSVARMNELGTLFTTIAGFMNLICILDALWHHRAPRPGSRPAQPAAPRTLKVPSASPGAAA